MDNPSRNAASSPARNHFDAAALLAMSPPTFPPSLGPFSPFLLARGTTAFQSPAAASSSPNHLLEGASACPSRSTQPPPASSSPSLPSGAWWSSADQGGMTLASLLRQGTSTPSLASSSKLDHALRQPQPQTSSSSQSRRRMNGSQAIGKMLPPSAHSRSSKHLDLLQDSILLNSVKEKLLLGSSAKGPPVLSPPFLGQGAAELLGASKAGGSSAAEGMRPGITLPLGSLVRERSGLQGRRSRRGRRESGLASAAAAKLTDCLMPPQPSSSSPSPSVGVGSLSSSPSLFPSPAHSSQASSSSGGVGRGHSPAPPAHSGAGSSETAGRGDGGAMPLDLCVKRSASSGGTAYLSPDVTLTPVSALTPGPPLPPPPPPAAHQRHILETLPASLGPSKAGLPLGTPLGTASSSSSRRRGRRPRSSPLLSDHVASARDCNPMGLLLGALAAQNAKLSSRQQESLQRFQLLASQGYKSRNNILSKSGSEGVPSELSASSGGRLGSLPPPLGAPSQPLSRPPSRELVSRHGTKRSSPDGEASSHRSKRQEVEHNASVSVDSSSDSESAVCDSRSMSGTSDTEDTEKSAAASTSSSIQASLSERMSKRHTDEHEGTTKRRRCYVTNEREARIPLKRGWQRQTIINSYGKSGVKGEVIYIAPCGKKLRSYPEVLKYLQQNNITDIGRENFSFSSRMVVGTFIETTNGGEDTDGGRVISEEEVALRLRLLCGIHSAVPPPLVATLPPSSSVAAAKGGSPLLGLPGLAGSPLAAAVAAGATSAGGSRRGRPRSRPSPNPQERALQEAVLMQQQHQVEEARRHHEQVKLIKQQERFERLEQQRIEKEMRTQQTIEEREIKRQQALILREQEMQKRREMLLMVDLERERRRQHMLLVRALENRKKMEDSKKLDMHILKEVRRPVEDMLLKDALPLPTLNRIPGLKVPGTAFANLLMVREFLHNFGETLHFDVDKIPSLNTLQLGLINHDTKSEQQLLNVVQHLLTCAIHDPGTLPCKEAVTVLGQHVKDATITNDTVTEALHLYFMALDKECAMYQWVTEKPFLALNPTQKSEIMAFLCNELLCSRGVVRQVDSSIETVITLRKDKWLAEGELRKLRSTQQSRQRKAILKQELENNAAAANGSSSSTTTTTNSVATGEVCANHASAANGSAATPTNKDSEENSVKGETASEAGDKASKSGRDEEEDNEDPANDSGNESDDPQEADNAEEEEDSELSLTNEELEKRIEKLSKQQAQFQNKVAKASSSIRAVMLGQDRFRRRYWLLPIAGGIFVEAMESCEQDGMGDFVASDYMADEDDSSSEDCSVAKEGTSARGVKEERQDEEESPALSSVKQEPCDLKEETEDDVPQVAASTTGEVKDEVEMAEKTDSPNNTEEPEKKQKETEAPLSTNEKGPSVATKEASSVASVPTSAANLSAVTTSATSASVTKEKSPLPEPTLEQSWMMHSPFFASIIAGNMLFNSSTFPTPGAAPSSSSPSSSPQVGPASTVALGKDGASPLFGGFTTPLSAEHMLKNLAQKKPWFSLLPRVPCDEESLARLPGSKDMDDDDIEEEASSTVGSTMGSSRVVSVIETEDTTNQYDKPQPVPPEYLRGWWRITDSAQLRTLMGALHSNGIREKALLKQLEKNFNYGTVTCIPNSQQDVGLEITDLDRDVSEKHGGAPPPDYEDQWSPDVALRVDLAMLAQVEALEQRLFGACMEVKHWRPPPKVSDDQSIQYRPSCVLLNKKLLATSDDDDEEESSASQTSGALSPDDGKDKTEDDTEGADATEEANGSQADADITIEDAGAKLPSSLDHQDDATARSPVANGSSKQPSSTPEDNYVNPVQVAKERLLGVEAGIERRYLRPPLGTSGSSLPQIANASSGGSSSGGNKAEEEVAGKGPGEEDEEPVLPPGLVRWREAVAACQTAAQLAMCFSQLEACIAWDRSFMKASCQFCHSGDNEQMLLLCDGCDKGYHTYCFKPKMDKIPDGDWYCYECLNKTQDEKVCILCGKKGKLVRCDACPKVFHHTCLDPPLSKPPKGKWCCSGCSKGRKKGRPSKGHHDSTKESSSPSKKTAESSSSMAAGGSSSASPCQTTKSSKSGERREKNKAQVLKDLAACRQILEELEQHKDAWPFLVPVNTKQFPSYRKFIKKPMDVSTMRSKLESNQYKCKDEFALDVRLIFDNCETFNEDDSPVGQAGHNMRNFFESRWEELTS
ncbi:bromodomain adjacent to zinc finger domain protein 2B isoform X4 [Rhipicephalus microplus]|uniref:bromodomain adjacent to zinc finger domain protein 2B isoform X4 n=1 Tax=Rhipicephalus microplus TaxID=6941 RepID=UPI002376B2B3